MAPSSSLAAAREMPPPQQQSPAAAGGAREIVEDIETAVWSWQAPAALAQPGLQQAAAPPPAAAPASAPAPVKQRSNVVVTAVVLWAVLFVLLIGGFFFARRGFFFARHVGIKHREDAPNATLTTQTGSHHMDMPAASGNASSAPAANATLTATATTTAEAGAPTSSSEAAATSQPTTPTSTTTAAATTSTPEATTTSPSTTSARSTSLPSGGASTTESTTTMVAEVKCYNFYSHLNTNPLQKYNNNPDNEAFGFATCKLCTNGTMHCTSLLHGGKSDLIASHIHLSEGPDADGAKSEGPPVINFCGSNSQGLILDGIDYTGPCEQWTNGAAHNRDMAGVLVPNFNRGITAAQRVEDIVKRPNMYYFSFHSLASWNHWYPTPHGMARGVLVLQGLAN